MKKTLLIACVVIFAVSWITSAAASIEGDIEQAMYFRRSSYSEPDSNLAQFKENQKKIERTAVKKEHELEQKDRWIAQRFTENEDFKDAKAEMQTFKRGTTTNREVYETLRHPRFVSDPSRPWKIVEWRLNQYLKRENYPAPRKDIEKVVAGRFYYTEYYPPRMGIRLDILATLNKKTRLLDFDHYYFDTGYIQKYWLLK